MPLILFRLLLLAASGVFVTSFRTKVSSSSETIRDEDSQWTPTGDCHEADGRQFSEQDKEKCMVKLIEEVNGDPTFQTFVEARTELLRRVNLVEAFGEDTENANRYKENEDSVFNYVKAHSENLNNKLDTYARQFERTHEMDHKTFTEKWLLEHVGEEIQLEGVMANPTFEDFVGVYDLKPMSSYIASKMIIDESDFMGFYDLGNSEPEDITSPTNTYKGVEIPANVEIADLVDTFVNDSTHAMSKMSKEILMRELKESSHNSVDEDHGSEVSPLAQDAKPSCGCSDSKQHLEMPHALGEGEYIQFRLRNENVRKYMDNGKSSRELMKLVPDTPNEPIYIFTVSSNGVMRFHPWGITARKLWHALGDSETAMTLPLNIWHAGKYGCFCFGIIYKEREKYTRSSGEVVEGGRTIVMRYNRWATDNAPVYAMIRQRADAVDKSIPEQPGNMFTGLDLEILEDLFQKLKDATNINKWLAIADEHGEAAVVPRRQHGKGYPDENPILALGSGDNITASSTIIKNPKYIAKDKGRGFTVSYAEVFERIVKDIPGLKSIEDAYLTNFADAVIHAKADSLSVCNRKVERAECWSGFAIVQCHGSGSTGVVRLSCVGVGLGEPCLQRAYMMSVNKPRSSKLSSMCAKGRCKCDSGNAPPIERCTCQDALW